MGESEQQSVTDPPDRFPNTEIPETETSLVEHPSEVAPAERMIEGVNDLEAVRKIESAIRSGRIDTSPLPTRPELRRVQHILEGWRLLLPVAILVISVSIPLLAHLGLWDLIDREISTGVTTPPEKAAFLWPSLVYLIPALGLILFAGSIVRIQVHEFMKATRTSGFWVWLIPAAILVLTFVGEVVILFLGTNAPTSARIVMSFTLGLVVLLGLLVNWFVVTATRHDGISGFWPKFQSHMLCLGICVVVVGAGFGILFSLDVRGGVIGDENMPSEQGTADSVTATVDSGSQNDASQLPTIGNAEDEPAQDDLTTADRGSGDGPGLSENQALGIFFVFVWVLIGLGIFWANKAIIWCHDVSAYPAAVSNAIRGTCAGKKKIPKLLASDLGNRLGSALSRSRATELAGYLDAACWAAAGTPQQPEGQLVNIWTASALRSGIQFVYDAPAKSPVSYYMIYVHVVRGVAVQLYKSFSSGAKPLPESLPGDVLVAARRMSFELADLIYRADVQPVLAKHPPAASTGGPPDKTP